MKINRHLFSTNMVDIDGKKNALQTKELTSQSVKELGAVDPKAQVSADVVKGKKALEEDECSAAPQKKVTSQMLLNKFQRDRERQQRREEGICRNEEHWKYPFFIHCWEEGLTLPSADNCPECNGFYCDKRSYKRSRCDDGPHRSITGGRHEHEERVPVHDRLGSRVPAHDRLGSRVTAHERLKGDSSLKFPRSR